MGLVYRVFHRGWGIDVAVKRPRQDYFRTDGQKRAFIRECETWIGIGLHQNVVACHYVRSIDDIPCIFAEYVEGGTLSDAITSETLYKGRRQESTGRILDIAIQMAWGLHFAHERGIVHQDVKPGNVLLTSSGEAKITDFGIARARSSAHSENHQRSGTDRRIFVTSGGMTPVYCSPEQAAGKAVSTKSDIWSWGVSVLEMFAGGVTWLAGQAAREALDQFIRTRKDDHRLPPIPSGLVDVLRACFVSKPEHRPKDLEEIAEKLIVLFSDVTGHDYDRPRPTFVAAVPDTLNNAALSLLDLGRVDDALNRWQEALRLDNVHIDSTYNSSIVRWRQGRFSDEDALRQVRVVVDRLPNAWMSHYTLSLVESERGNIAAARDALDMARQFAPDERVIAEGLRELSVSDTARWGRLKYTLRGHTSPVTVITVSKDGQYLLSGSKDKTARIWNLHTGMCNSVLSGHTDPLRVVAFSADAQLAVTASGGDDEWRTDDNSVRLWDTTSGRCTRILRGHIDRVSTVALTPSGKVVLSGGYDRTLRVWNVETGQAVQLLGHTLHIWSGWLSTDGSRAASLSEDGTLRFWDCSSGACLKVYQRPKHAEVSEEQGVATLGRPPVPDGVTFATPTQVLENPVLLSQNITVWPDSRPFVDATGKFAFSADSGDGGKALVWHIDTARRLISFPTGYILRFAHTDGVIIAVAHGENNTILIWQLPNPGLNRASPMLLSKVRRTAELSRTEKQFQKLLSQINEEAEQLPGRALEHLEEARMLPGFHRNVSIRDSLARLAMRGRRAGLRTTYPIAHLEGNLDVTRSVCFTSTTSGAVSVGWDTKIRLWDLRTRQCSLILPTDDTGGKQDLKRWLVSLAVGNDRWCLAGRFSGPIELWDLQSGTQLKILEGHTNPVASVAFSSDCRFAVSASNDKTVRLWNIESGQCVRVLTYDAPVTNACFSLDDSYILVSSDGVRLLDINTSTQWRYFGGSSALLTPDARVVVSLEPGGVGVWDVRAATRTFLLPVLQPKERFDQFTSMCLTPDGRFLAIAQGEKGVQPGVQIWDIKNGIRVGALEGRSPLSFSGDARFLLCGDGKALRLWELEWDWEFPDQTDWDDDATPLLEFFLTRSRPYEMCGSNDARMPARKGAPRWDERDFESLLKELSFRGYGWLRSDGIRRKLDDFTRMI